MIRFRKTRVEMFDAHFRKDQTECHRQDDQEGRRSIRDRTDEQVRGRLAAKRDQADKPAGHSEQKHTGDQRHHRSESESGKRQPQPIGDRCDDLRGPAFG